MTISGETRGGLRMSRSRGHPGVGVLGFDIQGFGKSMWVSPRDFGNRGLEFRVGEKACDFRPFLFGCQGSEYRVWKEA